MGHIMSDWIAGNRYLTTAEMQNNARMFRGRGLSIGWSSNAIFAMLGNIQAESGINPGIWENLTPYAGGYGLTQWTPYTKYSEWWGDGWENNGDAQMQRISFEAVNDLQWFRNAELGIDPPITLSEFLVSSRPVDVLTKYWLWFYEHPADPGTATQNTRISYARAWEDFFKIPAWLLFKFGGGKL